jgi:uncharacterized protein YdiU (UPF0061 family)
MGEFMFHLGIPTTRALALFGSDTKIVRDCIVNAGLILRTATSFVRFGTFEYFYYAQEHEKLKQLADFVIDESYCHVKNKKDKLYFSSI